MPGKLVDDGIAIELEHTRLSPLALALLARGGQYLAVGPLFGR